RENDYYGGIVAALDIIIPLAKGEYSEKLNRQEKSGGITGIVFVLLILALFVYMAKRKGPKNFNNRGSGDFRTGMILGNMLGGSHGNSWGSFKSGSGGFGGFGGGSFGGGGAGGSW
ncbi:MAG: TPM domain-containing protein, partial [Bacteroidales bacterium]|nr:TPM domain-containing protein [Bacteroidales bacterium]